MYNKVIMMGRICNDLALKETSQGTPVLTFTIACDRRFQQKGEDRKADFFNCIAWRNEAEFISRYFVKGKPILIEGELQNRTYKDKNGAEKWITEIIIDRAAFTGSDGKKEQPPLPDEPPKAAKKEAAAEQTEASAGDVSIEPTDDAYPF